MTNIGQIERITQNRVIELFKSQLNYRYLGNWEERQNNSNVEVELLSQFLSKTYSEKQISQAIHELTKVSTNLNDGLYNANQKVYQYLRYGIPVKVDASENFQTIHLIDWSNPENNDFAIAEEVTILGQHDKRPDIVLYINGIALAVIELKRSTVSVGDGIRQSIVNQKKDFIEPFFTTIQFVIAGNDTEGLRYGTIKTPEKYFLKWKEDSNVENLLDKYLLKLCPKERFLDIIYNFVVYDAGIKKLPRHHQYFGVKAAQEYVRRKEGGIIWHTQGSGKSIVMVILAKWILENNPNARVVVITDRDELDKQIERVFRDTGEQVKRTTSGRDLMDKLSQPLPRLLCSLVHKFGKRGVDNFEEFLKELQNTPTQTVGELFVFVDECHRTQSGKLHKVMKAILKNSIFIGFTGTPLLKKDKQTTLEVFGKYLHTYKFREAVEDEVILDLVYEARDIDQRLSSPDKVDAWFKKKTQGLNSYQIAELKKKWGTMQKLLSSRSRIEKIVTDIIFDFTTKPRLSSETGNAILVASSIYEACKYYVVLQKSELKGKCAVITSYNPTTKDITTEDTGANTETDMEFIYNTYTQLLKETNKPSTEKYEEEAKKLFIKQPANMKLLVVVDKLLTGFDAPPCSYLYIDKSMQDHGLFQAICRVNRLDTEDKLFGYIVDYKDLFKKVENAVAVYTSDLEYDTFEQKDCDILLQNRIESGKQRLDAALEELALLCEPVESPKEQQQYIRYFCGDPENPEDLKIREVQRTALYKNTISLIRAFANLADIIDETGYTTKEIDEINKKLKFYTDLREEIRKVSGEVIDTKTYEADMRFLIDNFIQADEPRKISELDSMSLLEIISLKDIETAINNLPSSIKSSKQAVAETIENNVRQKIIKENLIDPAFYSEMSILLQEIIKERKANAISYEEYLKKIAALAKNVFTGNAGNLPSKLKTKGQVALYNNLKKDENLAIALDEAVKYVKKADWRGNQQKENEIKRELFNVLKDTNEVERIFSIIKQQNEY